jgi:hypothetical protein
MLGRGQRELVQPNLVTFIQNQRIAVAHQKGSNAQLDELGSRTGETNIFPLVNCDPSKSLNGLLNIIHTNLDFSHHSPFLETLAEPPAW